MLPHDIWRALGGVGDPPSALGRENGPALVLGDARGVWDDVAVLEAGLGTLQGLAVCGVAQAAMWWRDGTPADWCNLHFEHDYWAYWLRARENGFGDSGRIETHSIKAGAYVRNVWPCSDTFVPGGSGLFAVLVQLMLGRAPVVLAGVPLDDGGRFHAPPWERSAYGGDTGVTLAWRQARDRIFAGRVFSMSGRTREWLGTVPDGI